jgi:Glycosyltransferases, probably involved in cell wall biogenesis
MTPTRRPKVTVYIPCHNYGHYLREAVDSMLRQLYPSWELLLINDGAIDDSAEIMDAYQAEHPDRIRVFHFEDNKGLSRCANFALENARGDYIMRLDADDYLDSSALLVMATHLDNHPEVDLLYPNYTYVDQQGNYIGTEMRKKLGVDTEVFDLPGHGACTMVRKRVIKSIGGYSRDLVAQDGYELWLKVLKGYTVDNVETPLFFYRQHGSSLSRNREKIMDARMSIMRNATENNGQVKPRVGAIIPVKNSYPEIPNIALDPFLDRPLIDYTLDVARGSDEIDVVVVTTDDPAVVKYCSAFPDVVAFCRPERLLTPDVMMLDIVNHALSVIEQEYNIYLDIVTTLSIHSPLREVKDVHNALDTLKLFKVDSVVSVYEDHDLHMVHGKYGLEPLNPGALQRLRHEREALYVPNGAVDVRWREVVTETDLYGRRIGHTIMPRDRSFQMRNSVSRELMEVIMRHMLDDSPHVSFNEDGCMEFFA